METNNQGNNHQVKAKKLKKLRRWQRVASLAGIVVIAVGIVQAVMLFLNYKHTETSNDAQIEQYISPVNLRASGYIKKIYFTEHQNVKKGDTVKENDEIIIMEAMKMENPIYAPCSGVIADILVSQGDQLQADDPILVIA